MAEEKSLIAFVQSGRGKFKPFRYGAYQFQGFTPDGDIRLANGWVVSEDYGNLTHGYCVTSYTSQ